MLLLIIDFIVYFFVFLHVIIGRMTPLLFFFSVHVIILIISFF